MMTMKIYYNSRILNLASGLAYVGGRIGEGRAQAADADGRRAQTGCGRGYGARVAAGKPKFGLYSVKYTDVQMSR